MIPIAVGALSQSLTSIVGFHSTCKSNSWGWGIFAKSIHSTLQNSVPKFTFSKVSMYLVLLVVDDFSVKNYWKGRCTMEIKSKMTPWATRVTCVNSRKRCGKESCMYRLICSIILNIYIVKTLLQEWFAYRQTAIEISSPYVLVRTSESGVSLALGCTDQAIEQAIAVS